MRLHLLAFLGSINPLYSFGTGGPKENSEMRRVTISVFSFISLFLAGFILIPNAYAGNISKKEVTEILTEQGYAVRDFQGMLAVSVGEHDVLVSINGDDADITYVTYIIGVDVSAVGYEFLSKFNSTVKFGRAFVDRDGDITLQMDRNSSGGVSAENIESDFDVFLLLISQFLLEIENLRIT